MSRVHPSGGFGALDGRTMVAYADVVDRARREVQKIRRRHGDALQPDFLELARRWGNAIEQTDAFTRGHCDRVADLACGLAGAIGFDEEALYWLRVGALLHDVGKFVVPPEVLNKDGALTPAEWAVVRRHPVAGVEMVADVRFPREVMDVLQSHHERWDGKGYPHGLRGAAIPRGARIVGIADTYDALTSRRPYKGAITHEDAMAILRREQGRQFDPALLASFERMMAGRLAGTA